MQGKDKPRMRMSGLVPCMLLLSLVSSAFRPAPGPAPDPAAPAQPVRLIFIHHSTGENWLRDDYGGLGLALAENNYFVSDTNYGWGPDSIGDRTDIPDWLEWFASGQTPSYMEALFSEGEQHSDYSRLFGDPGGENTVVLFKSCFPNSALEGSPQDGPDPEGWLTVGHAKYVYNQILGYFATRPDKLFIVITAPPLSDRSYAANARAFNQWLVNDWLLENEYSLNNVAVFDFYNVLTARDAHHRISGGEIEHLTTGRDTLFYPSGDDHPSAEGSRKATEEFLPLLNTYYNRWLAASGSLPAPAPSADPQPTQPQASLPEDQAGPAAASGQLIADFDQLSPPLEAYWDEQTSTRIQCAPAGDAAFAGSQALRIDFSVAPGSWSTCLLTPAEPPDWSQAAGLQFALHASRPGIPYEIMLIAGPPEAPQSYIDYADTPQDSSPGWAVIEIPWSDFSGVDWEANAGQPFDRPQEILSLSFGFSAGEEENTGTVWIDELALLDGADEPQAQAGSRPVCPGSLLGSLLLLGAVGLGRSRRRSPRIGN